MSQNAGRRRVKANCSRIKLELQPSQMSWSIHLAKFVCGQRHKAAFYRRPIKQVVFDVHLRGNVWLKCS